MATSKWKEAKGNIVNYDTGKFQVRVKYLLHKDKTFKFIPYVMVFGGGFTKDRTAVFEWNDHSKAPKKKVNGKNVYTDTFLEKNSTQTKVKKSRTVHQAAIYYADRDKKKKKKHSYTEKYYKKKKKGKGKELAKHKVSENVDKSGEAWTNYDGYVKITCTIGKHVSSVTLDQRGKPFAPKDLSASRPGKAYVQVLVDNIKALPNRPVRSAQLQRQAESPSQSGDFSDIGLPQYFGNAASGGDLNGVSKVKFEDRTVEDGKRYRYRVVASNAKGPTTSAATGWYYTDPPDISDVSHSRRRNENEKNNDIRFSRSNTALSLGYFKGFEVQYSTQLKTDPDIKQTWASLGSSYRFFDPDQPSTTITKTFTGNGKTRTFTLDYPTSKSNITSITVGSTSVTAYTLNGSKKVVFNTAPANKSKITIKYRTVGVPVKWNWLSTGHGNDILLRHEKCERDRTYRYRIRSFNYWNGSSKTQYSPWFPNRDGTDPTYNEPYPPKSVNATFNAATGFVDLVIERQKTFTTADKMFIQRKESGNWVDVPSGGAEGIDISPKTDTESADYDKRKYTYTDDEVPTGSSDEIRYRVAFACTRTPEEGTELAIGNGRTTWVESNDVIMVSKPNPATLTTPVNNSYAITTDQNARLSWIHSPTDGTEQEEARIYYKTNSDSTWTMVTVEKEAYYTLPIESYESGTEISWKVTTRGKHPSFSNDSEVYKFTVYEPPSISWRKPASAAEVSNLPLPLEWGYEDSAGALESLTLLIEQDGAELASFSMPTELTEGIGSYKLKDYLFDDEETYELTLSAKSTIGLSATSTISITVKYISIELSNGFMPTASFDSDTGFVQVELVKPMASSDAEDELIVIDGATSDESAEADADDPELIPESVEASDASITKMYLYRVYEGERVLLETINVTSDNGVDAGSYQIMDYYAPMNVDYQYQVLQITTEGEVAINGSTQHFDTLWWYVYYGDGEMVKARWNPSGNASFRRPEKQQIRYSGREYPVTYDSSANEETYSFTTTLYRDIDDGREVLEQFKDLMRSGGSGVWKSFEGDVYEADFDFSYSSDYTDGISSWQCTLNVTRIDSEEAL